jgi:hypothetical protein
MAAMEQILAERSPVVLWRHEHGIRVAPADAAVRRALTTRARFRAAPPGGHGRSVPVPVLLGLLEHEGGQPVLYTRPTLAPVVLRSLATAGRPVEVRGIAPRQLPPPRLDRLAAINPPDLPLLGLMQNHEYGLIRHSAGVDAARLIAQVWLAWPDLKVAVVVKRRDDAQRLTPALRRYLAGVSTCTNSTAGVAGVAVATYAGLGQTVAYAGAAFEPFELGWLDIVIALDAQEATAGEAMLWMSGAARARLYGLMAADAKPAPLDRDHLAVLFGFEEVTIPSHGHHERPVRVAFITGGGGRPVQVDLEDVEVKRQDVWFHGRRNRLLARLGRQLRQGDRQQRGREFSDVAAGVTFANETNILLVVENVEHGLALADRLPGWPLLTGEGVARGGLTRHQRRKLRDGRAAPLTPPWCAIATFAALPDVPLGSTDVLVRADGGVGLPPVRPWQLAQPNGDDRPLLVVDVVDRHHALLRRWSRRRRAAYAERGWFAAGVDPVRARVDAFLAARPQEVRDE